jgi:hypothetical protein
MKLVETTIITHLKTMRKLEEENKVFKDLIRVQKVTIQFLFNELLKLFLTLKKLDKIAHRKIKLLCGVHTKLENRQNDVIKVYMLRE